MSITPNTPKPTADVIIFGGQSNMQGQSECLSECERVDGAYEYRLLSDTLVPLRNPVGEDVRYDGQEGDRFVYGYDPHQWLADHALGSACYGHTNLVPAFVRAYLQETETTVVAVHAAKGSTMACDWLPGTRGYEALTRKAASALRKAREEYALRHVYFVWLQGESDACAGVSNPQYRAQLTALAEGLRVDLGVERFGVIRVGAFAHDERDDEIISAQDQICREHPFFAMLTHAALSLNGDAAMMNPYVPGHYSARGLEYLGEAAGHALGKMAR